eukprot:38231-Chlamydomonas_euryale.AAC.1
MNAAHARRPPRRADEIYRDDVLFKDPRNTFQVRSPGCLASGIRMRVHASAHQPDAYGRPCQRSAPRPACTALSCDLCVCALWRLG